MSKHTPGPGEEGWAEQWTEAALGDFRPEIKVRKKAEEIEHTPGPWSVNTNEHYERGKPGLIWGPAGPGRGCVCVLTPVYPREFNVADACLIAAAPDLLVACEAIVHAAKINDPAAGGVAATLAFFAIAKAKERT
ncbi:hypothetical protein LCGC14_0325940 [marine sediment metagenome]|uniref:Uncharacterized protein n=1 Tax=marine sediment metagenome TaxID=412755 RepID=A0A0F9WPZ9_9ZZZZ